MGYMRVNKWFTEMSGRGLAERKRAVARTTEVKKEEDIFLAVEQWEEELRDLRRITAEEVMSEMLMKTALREICCGKIKEWVDMKEETLDHSELREEVMKFAMKKRVERKKTQTSTGMDVDALIGGLTQKLNEQSYDFTGQPGWGKGSNDEQMSESQTVISSSTSC